MLKTAMQVFRCSSGAPWLMIEVAAPEEEVGEMKDVEDGEDPADGHDALLIYIYVLNHCLA